MSKAFLIWHIHCRLRIGGTRLLPKLGKSPTSSSVMASQRTFALKWKRHIKAEDPHCNRRQQARPSNDASNPHSAVATTEPRSPRPRGFLP